MPNRGGYEKRRLQQKRERERLARKRQQRNRRFAQVMVVLTVLALIMGVTFALVSGGEDKRDLGADDDPKACTTPGPDTLAQKKFANPPCMTIDPAKTYTATMKTSMGTVEVNLLAADAPKTVNNFVFLARQKFYDGSIFHRVIPDFGGKGSHMVQGGDAANRDGSGDAGYKFEDENLIAFDKPGFLAMANSGPATNGSQFFFITGTVQHLNAPGTCPAQQGQQASCHSIFGSVVSGLDVVTKIAQVKRENDKPVKDVVLINVTIEEK